MTLDKRRVLHAAKHAHIYQPALMKSKSLDFLEVFLLQSQCRLNELYAIINKFIVEQPLSDEDQKMFWAYQQDLATIQSDITTLILVREQLDSVTGDFDKACNEITNETVSMYLEQTKSEQDPSAEFRAQLERALSHNIEPDESHE
tara:strand:- start:350 stop:787 length:438 start_codon:yes stop_codon:yes gene_type:complete